MSLDEIKAQESIFRFLKDTNEIYNMCKKYSILIEELLPKHKAPIHAANELKALVFHLYNASKYPADLDTNIIEATEHLCRAFYDLHSLLISIYIQQIRNKLSVYQPTTIANSFQEYGNTIRPALREIQESLRDFRTNRNTDVAIINANISDFEQQVRNLARFDDIVESMKPIMNKYELEQKRKTISKIVWDIVKVIIIGALALGLGYYLAKVKDGRGVDIQNQQQPK
jgi:hypothetical protein